MRRLSFALDAVPMLREAAASDEMDLCAAATLAELAGAHAVRIGVSEDLKPTSERDVLELRRSARCLELRVVPHTGLLKLTLEARPDLVVLSGWGWAGPSAAAPIDLRERDSALTDTLRGLEDAGISRAALIAPEIEAVKEAHAAGLSGVELFTGSLVDLPDPERKTALERLGDAARLAAKLRLEVAVAGGLKFSSLVEVLDAAPVCRRVVAGRSVVARALLVGIDQAVRDFRALCG